jgi:rhamnose transport system permease protein
MLTRYRRELSVSAAILVVAAILALVAPRFFTVENARDLVATNIPVLIVTLGTAIVIITRQIDISVGSQFAICGVLCAALAKAGLPVVTAGLAACAAGVLLGSLNGALVAYVRIPSIVVTLATMVALRDALRWTTEGAWVQDLPVSFQWFGRTQGASEAITGAVALFLVGATHWILRNVAAGRAVYATGSDANAAELAGISTARVTFCAFAVAGGLTGCAAFLNSIRFNQVPSNAGIGLEMKVIAAAVVGGTAITGGRGAIPGVLLGVILLGMIGPALTFLGVSAYWERAVQGAIILAAVAADSIRVTEKPQTGVVAPARA